MIPPVRHAEPGGPDSVVTAIATVGLTKRFGEVLAVDDLDLTVERGEVFGFLGPNGAGKTTTIRMLLDLARPTAGSATVLGRDTRVDAIEVHRRIGYLPGELDLPKDLTAREFLDFAADLRPAFDPAWRDDLCERFDVPLDRDLGEASTGNRQKVGLVQAFMHRPEVVFLDEPSRGLDPLVQHEFHRLIGEACGRGTTVFLSSHTLSEVERVADRVGILRHGRLVVVDTLERLRSRARRTIEIDFAAEVASPASLDGLPGVVSVRTQGATVLVSVDGPLDAVLRAALALGEVVNIRTPEANLEEIFLDYYRAQPEDSGG